MLNWWKCTHCELSNFAEKQQCQACFKKKTKTSSLDQIMHDQRLLFDGFLRMEILNHLTQNSSKLLSHDVINLCHTFYILKIESLMKDVNEEYKSEGKCSWLNQQKFERRAELFILVTLANKLIDNREFFVAIEILRTLAETNVNISYKTYAIVQYNYGISFKRLGEYQLALRQFQKAIDLSSDDADFYMKAASCYQRLQDNDAAKIQFLKAIEMEPDEAKYHAHYADFCATDLNDYDEAKYHFDKAIELDPDNAWTYLDYARMYRNKLKDYKEAEKYYLKSLELDGGEDCTTNASFAYMLYLMGDMERAKKYIDIQVKMDEEDNNIFSWSWFYYGLIYKETAEESFMKSVECIRTKEKYAYCLIRLQELESNDPSNSEYYEQYKQLLAHKFG